MNPISNITENKIDYDVEIQLAKGWNLIVGAPVWETGSYISESSAITKDNIKASYYYASTLNKYLQVYPKSKEFDEHRLDVQNQNPDQMPYLAQSPVWIYSNKAGILKYTRYDFPNPSYPTLSMGWNFMTMTPEMVGKNIMEFKGTCNVEKAFGWEPDKKAWNDLLDERLPEEATGAGFIIKVSNTCRLENSGSSSDVPQLPQ